MEEMNPILLSLIISMAIQAFFFAFAATLKTDKVTDLSYGLSFIAIALYWFFRNENPGIFELILTLMVVLWGIRIAGYLLFRIIKTGTDKRFDDRRDDLIEFGKFWLLQGVAVWVISLPVIYLLTRQEQSDFGIFASVGLVVWLAGIAIETLADYQLYQFRFNKPKSEKENEWIDEGLWHYSRHPNYFGEMTLWWGLFLFGIGVYSGLGWLSIIGPIAITMILRYGTGVPPIEKSHNKKWGDKKAYQKYKKSTNLLILGPKS